MKRVGVRGVRRARLGSVSARGPGRRMVGAGAFAAMLVTPAQLRVGRSFVKFEGATEIGLKALWKWEQKER